MKKTILSVLILFCVFAPNFSVIPTAVVYANQQPLYNESEECTQKGISPSCDDELDHPIDDDKQFTINDAINLIKSGVTTPKDLLELGMITLEQKQQIDLQIMPERR